MSRPDYLSLLREENFKKNVLQPNLVKGEKSFARFTGYPLSTNRHKDLDRASVNPVTQPITPVLVPMTFEQKESVMDWLIFIDEIDPKISADVIAQCETNANARFYFIGRTKDLLTKANNPDLHSCNDCQRLSSSGICGAATKLGATLGYRPVLGRRLDHRCPEWKPP